MLPAFGVHRNLTKKIFAIYELPVKLAVQIVAIGQHDDGRAVERFLKQMGVHHRQRLPATLRVPENPSLAVGERGFLVDSIAFLTAKY